ncbi:RidA family protein [Terriglobus aquaticus]|uniref:RidA family protein n=1 Tax=Terriglobus aquaticus TaxID=940139 RepID=A0ABW9KNL1_9BACT|nr:RidA family protein [Terriglobus aquaticus]
MFKHLCRAAVPVALLAAAPLLAQENRHIDAKPEMPFSQAVIAGNTIYIAGQEGPENGKLEGVSIETQTTNAIHAIEKIVTGAGYKMTDLVTVTVFVADLKDVPAMNEIYKKLMPFPRPARATVQVAGLIGNAKIEISAIAVKP